MGKNTLLNALVLMTLACMPFQAHAGFFADATHTLFCLGKVLIGFSCDGTATDTRTTLSYGNFTQTPEKVVTWITASPWEALQRGEGSEADVAQPTPQETNPSVAYINRITPAPQVAGVSTEDWDDLYTKLSLFYAQTRSNHEDQNDDINETAEDLSNDIDDLEESLGTAVETGALTVTGNVSVAGSLTLSALGGGVLTTDANGVVSTTTVGASAITDDSLDFAQFADALSLDAATSIDFAGNTLSLQNGTTTIETLALTNPLSASYLDASVLLSAELSTSAQLANLLSDETGTGSVVFSASPTFTGTVQAAAATLSSTLTLSGTAANIALGSNYLSGDGDDEGVFVSSTGNVGIGTTTPSEKLSVVGNTEITGALNLPSTSSSDGILIADQYRISRFGGSQLQFVDETDTSTSIVVGQIDSKQGTFEAAGAGTGTSGGRFRLRTAADFDTTIDAFDITASADDLVFSNASDTQYQYLKFLDTSAVVVNGGSADLDFRVESDLNTHAFFVEGSSGDVGIGTTDPTAKLTVGDDSETNTALTIWSEYQASGFTNSNTLNFRHGSLDRWRLTTTQYSSDSDAFDLTFTAVDNNAIDYNDWMTIRGETGYVGIGTTTPQAKLHVRRSDSDNSVAIFETNNNSADIFLYGASGKVRLRETGSGEFAILTGTTNPNTERFNIDSTGAVTVNALAGVGNRCLYVTAAGVISAKASDCGSSTGADNLGNHSATQNIVLNSFWLSGDGGSEGIAIDASGKVGIGTASPTEELEIFSTTPGFELHDSTDNQNVVFLNDADRAQLWVGGSERLSVSEAGNVGIGTTSPERLLNVVGGASGAETTLFELRSNFSGTDTGTALRLTNSSVAGAGRAVEIAALRQVDGSNDFVFRAGTTGGALSEYMRIVGASGNVGIGTTTPAQALTVVGDTYITGNLTLGGAGTTTIAGNISLTGSIIPTADITYDLGSPTRQWRDVYIGPGSLYINGQKVLEESGSDIVVSADDDQNLMVEAGGVGSITTRATGSGNANVLSGSGNINITSTSGNINLGTSGTGQLNLGTVASGTWNGTDIDISDYTNLTVSATGLSLSGDALSLAAGYVIPLTASTTQWATAYSWGDHATVGYLADITGESLEDLADVATMTPNTGDLLSWNGSAWASVATSSLGITAGGGGSVGSSSVSFSVHKNGTNQTMPSNESNTLLTWSTEVFDTNNNFSSNRFTPTVAGKYLVTLNVHCASAPIFCISFIYKNGSPLARHEMPSGTVGGAPVTVIVDMNGTTDYLEAYQYNDNGAVVSGNTTMSYFSGSLIAPTDAFAAGWANDETQSYLADANDLVAIGTSTAAAKLDVWGSAGSSDILAVSSSTGNRLLTVSSAGNLGLASSAYFNWGNTLGESGYGIRDNAGTLEFKNSGGTWAALGTGSGGSGTATSGPSFSVHKNGTNQTVPTNTETLLTWSTEEFDTNDNFDLSTERFTPTVAGKYIITLTAYCSDSTAYCNALIYKNGVAASGGFHSDGDTIEETTMIIDMNGSTDYVEARVSNGGGTTISGITRYTHFTGSLIAPLYASNSGWSMTGSEIYATDLADNVGIGTTTASEKLTVYGNQLFEGDNRYLLFGTGTTTASNGYGIRDNAGTLEFKNSGGTWAALGTGSGGGGSVGSSSVSFSVHKGGTNQTVVANTATILTWSTEEFDTNNNFDLATGRFTPTVAGKYIINVGVYCSDSTAFCEARIDKNGALYKYQQTRFAGSVMANVVAIVEMNGTTDYLEAVGYNSAGTTIAGTTNLTFFQGSLLAPTNAFAAGWSNDETQSYLADANDLVAIGTSTAAAKLHVVTSGSTDQIAIENSGTGGGRYDLYVTNAASSLGGDKFNIYDWNADAARLTIDSSGNVGIGTTSPSERLHVSGGDVLVDKSIHLGGLNNARYSDASGNGGITFSAPGDYSNGSVVQVSKNASSAWSNMYLNIIDPTATYTDQGNRFVHFYYDGASAWTLRGDSSNNFYINRDSVSGNLIIPTGNVGIGTTSPSAVLQLAGEGSILKIGRTDSTTSNRIQFLDDAAGSTLGYIGYSTNSGSGLVTGGTANSLVLRAESADTFISSGATPVATFKSAGNVGIGTTDPQDLLHIKAATQGVSDYQLILEGFAAGYGAGVSFQSNLNGGSLAEMARITADGEDTWNTTASTQDAGLRFFTSLNGAVSEKMRIDSDGNVGIGTTDPSNQLHIGANGSNVSIKFGRTGNSIGSGAIGANSGNALMVHGYDSGDVIQQNLFTVTQSGAIGFNSTDFTGSISDATQRVFIGPTGYIWSTMGSGVAERNLYLHRHSTSNGYVMFAYDTSSVGSITTNGTSVSYNTTSDRRMKEHIDTTKLGLETLMQLPVRDFSFINDPESKMTTGFIAQELYEVFPDAVNTNGTDGTSPLTASSTPWSVDYGRITPLLAKSIQELNLDLQALLINGTSSATSTFSFLDDEETDSVWSRLVTLARGFVDGVLTLAGVKTNELCITDTQGETCIDRDALKALLEATGKQASPVDDGDSQNPPADGVDPGEGETDNEQPPADENEGSEDEQTGDSNTEIGGEDVSDAEAEEDKTDPLDQTEGDQAAPPEGQDDPVEPTEPEAPEEEQKEETPEQPAENLETETPEEKSVEEEPEPEPETQTDTQPVTPAV